MLFQTKHCSLEGSIRCARITRSAVLLPLLGQLECNDEMEKFQSSEHLHADSNWRLPPKNSTLYTFISTPQRDRPQSLIMFAAGNQMPAAEW